MSLSSPSASFALSTTSATSEPTPVTSRHVVVESVGDGAREAAQRDAGRDSKVGDGTSSKLPDARSVRFEQVVRWGKSAAREGDPAHDVDIVDGTGALEGNAGSCTALAELGSSGDGKDGPHARSCTTSSVPIRTAAHVVVKPGD